MRIDKLRLVYAFIGTALSFVISPAALSVTCASAGYTPTDKMYGPDYVSLGEKNVFYLKGSYSDLDSMSATHVMGFLTSEDGGVGNATFGLYDWKIRARKDIVFDNSYHRGEAFVYAEANVPVSYEDGDRRGLPTYCKDVVVHNKPSIHAEVSSSSTIEAIYYVDNVYSKAVREHINPTITIKQGGASMVVTVPAIGRYGKESSSARNVRIEQRGNRYVGVTVIGFPGGFFDIYEPITAVLDDGQSTHAIQFKKARPSSSDSGSDLPFSGQCPSPRCEAPWRKCSSLGGTFDISGNSYVCRAK